MILKQLIKYDNAPCLEATWVTRTEREVLVPDVDPEDPETVIGYHTETVIDEVVVRCHAYSAGQMAMLRADLGADAAEHESLIAEIEATYVPPEPPPPASQFDLDQARYQKRAAVKDSLIAWMAADNMGRVRAGAWSVPELTSLMSDPAVAAANAYMSTLSFELAAQSILVATSPLLTPEIKAAWVGKLQEHFYLEG